MIDYLLKITHGTLQHIKGIDNIVDLVIFIIACAILIYCVTIAVSVGLYILQQIYDSIF